VKVSGRPVDCRSGRRCLERQIALKYSPTIPATQVAASYELLNPRDAVPTGLTGWVASKRFQRYDRSGVQLDVSS
jgi:hypothetical protein